MNAGTAAQSKVALITGASRGIGLAIARSLAGLGAKVALCARDPKRLEAAAAGLKQTGASVVAIPADIRRANEIESLVRETEQSLGPIEILVNNAGIGYFAPFQEASEANWDSVLDTNLKAVFLLSKAVAPGMIATPRRTHHQYWLALWQERLCGWRDLLRFEMGFAWPHPVHGGGLAIVRRSRQRGLARIGCHGLFAPYRQRCQQDAATRRRGSRGRKHRHPGAAKLYQRSAYPPHTKALTAGHGRRSESFAPAHASNLAYTGEKL